MLGRKYLKENLTGPNHLGVQSRSLPSCRISHQIKSHLFFFWLDPSSPPLHPCLAPCPHSRLTNWHRRVTLALHCSFLQCAGSRLISQNSFCSFHEFLFNMVAFFRKKKQKRKEKANSPLSSPSSQESWCLLEKGLCLTSSSHRCPSSSLCSHSPNKGLLASVQQFASPTGFHRPPEIPCPVLQDCLLVLSLLFM